MHHSLQEEFAAIIESLIVKFCATGDNNQDKVERMENALKDVQGIVVEVLYLCDCLVLSDDVFGCQRCPLG